MSRGLVEQLIAAPSVFIQPAHFHQKDLSSGDERKAEPSGNGATGDHGAVLVEHGEPILLSVHAEYAPVRQNVGRKNRYLQRRAMHGTVGKIEKTYRRGTIVEIPKAIPVKFGNTGKAAVRHAPHFFERFVQNDKLSGGVAQLTNDARFGTEFAISTPGSTPDLAWGNALVWVWGTSMTIKLTAEVSALLPPNWQTRLFANDPFTFEWEGIGTPVNVAKGQAESATGSIAVPAKKYIDLKKISDSIWIFSGTYAGHMRYDGTTEPSADLGVDGDEYLMYS